MRHVVAYPNPTVQEPVLVVWLLPATGSHPEPVPTENPPRAQPRRQGRGPRPLRLADPEALAEHARRDPDRCLAWFVAALAQELFPVDPDGVAGAPEGAVVVRGEPGGGLAFYMSTETYRALREAAMERYGVRLPPPGEVTFREQYGVRRLRYRDRDYVRVRVPGRVPECGGP